MLGAGGKFRSDGMIGVSLNPSHRRQPCAETGYVLGAFDLCVLAALFGLELKKDGFCGTISKVAEVGKTGEFGLDPFLTSECRVLRFNHEMQNSKSKGRLFEVRLRTARFQEVM